MSSTYDAGQAGHGRWALLMSGEQPHNLSHRHPHRHPEERFRDDDRGERHGRRGRRGGFGPGFGPGFEGGPGFGPGGPFGPRGRGRGHHGRGGRRAARGDVRASVLALVAEEPMHGYQIITELAERSGGAWKPSPGSVYPVLQQLADEGLVEILDSDGRRVVHLTDEGRTYVDEHADELTEPWAAVGGSPDETAQALWGVARQVAAATWQVAQAGSDAQLSQARDILAETRRSLYRLLAEDEPATADSDAEPTG